MKGCTMQSQLVLVDLQEGPQAVMDLTPEVAQDPKGAIQKALRNRKLKGKPQGHKKAPKATQRPKESKGSPKASPKATRPKDSSKASQSPWYESLAHHLNSYSKGYSFKVSYDSRKKRAYLTVATIPYGGWNWTYITSRVETEANKFMLAGCPTSRYRELQPIQSQINDIDERNYSLLVTEDKATRDDLPLLSDAGFKTIQSAVQLALKSKPKSYKLIVNIGEIGSCLYSKEREPKYVREFRKEEEERLASYGYGATL